ncbi:MAG TPA: alcohol dehydrogenase catalytic domain-containing protein [Candidatus Baltobacteraceae bacterium]|jgi:L-iditol 2-dehydrogenase|nr:alcohol dehydrogenase catalytic domain-containing protein [Candidatus Baltobacteraceae bacterium]
MSKKKMQTAVLYDVDDIRIEDREVPKAGAGELLIETRASGICTGDVLAWYVRRKAPLVLGHEPAGVIAEIGHGVSGFSVGDRVFVHHHAPCFHCRACARGDYVQCAAWRKSAIDPGGLAEYFRVPAANVLDTLRLPEGVPFVDGSLVEPLACVVKSIRRSGLRSGDTMYIIGLGVMGLMHAFLAHSMGARTVGFDLLEERREFAGARGIEIVDAHDKFAGADVVICGPGSPEAVRDAIAAVAGGGTVVMFTPLEPGIPLTLDPNDLYFRDVRLITSYSCGPNDTREALDLIARGVVTAQLLGAVTYPLQEAAQAYAALRASRILKPIVTFEPSLFA